MPKSAQESDRPKVWSCYKKKAKSTGGFRENPIRSGRGKGEPCRFVVEYARGLDFRHVKLPGFHRRKNLRTVLAVVTLKQKCRGPARRWQEGEKPALFNIGFSSGFEILFLALFRRLPLKKYWRTTCSNAKILEHTFERLLGGGFKYFVFSPLFEEDYHFDEHIFQMG